MGKIIWIYFLLIWELLKIGGEENKVLVFNLLLFFCFTNSDYFKLRYFGETINI